MENLASVFPLKTCRKMKQKNKKKEILIENEFDLIQDVDLVSSVGSMKYYKICHFLILFSQITNFIKQ